MAPIYEKSLHGSKVIVTEPLHSRALLKVTVRHSVLEVLTIKNILEYENNPTKLASGKFPNCPKH